MNVGVNSSYHKENVFSSYAYKRESWESLAALWFRTVLDWAQLKCAGPGPASSSSASQLQNEGLLDVYLFLIHREKEQAKRYIMLVSVRHLTLSAVFLSPPSPKHDGICTYFYSGR